MKNFTPLGLFLAVLVLLLTAVNVHIAFNKTPKVVIVDDLDAQRGFWLSIIRENPSYLDGYIVLADIEARRGNKALSEALLKEAFKINPLVFVPQTSR